MDRATIKARIDHGERVMRNQRLRKVAWAEAGGYKPFAGSHGPSSICADMCVLIPGRHRRQACWRGVHGPDYRRFLDHALTWTTPDGSRFVLAHVYFPVEQVLWEAQAWALERQLAVDSLVSDGWYGAGTTPLRWTFGG